MSIMKKLDIDVASYGSPSIEALEGFGYYVLRTASGYSICNDLPIDPFEYKIIDRSNIAESASLFVQLGIASQH